jgi:hypothetical protein
MIAGVLSPTVLLPGGSVVRSVRAGTQLTRTALSGGAWALAGATIDEGILYTTQETRTGSEVLLGIGTGAVLGGLIGGAAGLLTPRAVRSFEVNMATGGSERAIQSYMGGSLSAARTPEEALLEESAGGIVEHRTEQCQRLSVACRPQSEPDVLTDAVRNAGEDQYWWDVPAWEC